MGKEIEKVGVIIINIGIGWYEVCILIIVIKVLCVVFIWVIVKFCEVFLIFVIMFNCINMFDVVEEVLFCGDVDMVLMVCLFLVDFDFVCKV